MHKPKDLKGSKCILYFHGGGCAWGTPIHRQEVCNKIAVLSGCTVINCDYRKCPEIYFPHPVFDAYACLKQVIEDAD